MKVIVIGNAGAGKTTLARQLARIESAPILTLDQIAFADDAVRRPLAESLTDAVSFVTRSDSWVVEGCYADIIAPLLEYCQTLVFLNPGVTTCLGHCRRRPFEREKFDSADAQDANLEHLLLWVSQYEKRTDEYGLLQHRAVFDSFAGTKIEFTQVVPNAAQQVVALCSGGGPERSALN